MKIIVAFRPRNVFTNFTPVKMKYVGGAFWFHPQNGQHKGLKITYEDIPAGHKIWDISGQSAINSIKKYHKTGDPHLFIFGDNSFDNHTEGWVTLYDYNLGSHRITLEKNQLLLTYGLVAMKMVSAATKTEKFTFSIIGRYLPLTFIMSTGTSTRRWCSQIPTSRSSYQGGGMQYLPSIISTMS